MEDVLVKAFDGDSRQTFFSLSFLVCYQFGYKIYWLLQWQHSRSVLAVRYIGIDPSC